MLPSLVSPMSPRPILALLPLGPGEVGLFPGSYVEVVEAPAAPSKAAKPAPAPKPRGLGGPSALVNPAREGAMPETVEMVSFPRLVKPSRPPLAGKPAKFDPDHPDRYGFDRSHMRTHVVTRARFCNFGVPLPMTVMFLPLVGVFCC